MAIKKRSLAYLGGLVLLIGLAVFGVNYYLSLRILTINYKNINSVTVYSTKKLNSGSQKSVKKISHSGEEIKLPKGDYTLHYDAAKNYESLFVKIHLTRNHQVINLSPSYSDEYLDKMLSGELENIDGAILQRYPQAQQLYTIQRGKLYGQGNWYGTTLTYKGNALGSSLFQTDTLRIILQKKDGQWNIETNPPYILLSRDEYPNVPEDILRSVNAMPSKPAG